MKRDGNLESLWQSEIKHYGQEQISESSQKDVVIVGAGITGITCALMLQKKGFKCILVEANNIIKEAGSVIKHMVVDKLSVDKIVAFAELENDHGKVIKYEGDTLAVYKDATGKSYILESDCTHLYCTVKWNQEEKSWDCPCHGSRFSINGDVLNGPAVKKLKSLYESS